jgi:hypothetical protein
MSYAPQDGRYEFDFSAVKQDFDRNAVEGAIAAACRDYAAIGEAFMSDAQNRISEDRLDEGGAIEGAANGRLGAVRETLEAALVAHAPAGDGALLRALMEGQPAR